VTDQITRSEAETTAIGQRLGASLEAGSVVLLMGPLGAGKTAFTRGLAAGLGADPDDVSSPTFTIVQEYRGRVMLQHIDLYRLAPEEVDDLALEDLMEGSVLAVEWPDRWRRAPADAIAVTLDIVDDTSRRIAIGISEHR
jgi:tRNA threonylcarbamoyladenosine biosynthesis protein TsaE